ncbi:methyl-accepting chemotaxis protein [Pseudomaricurvus alkylphenolicus]|uniref:methyl-accepting chemotaxis protein n=1 Tax=Pseudomaricurvus alkylphenolicus TaxID=1306991 RepID=UPI001F11433E|nr:methyl-accepting chemotaxis protein [Pseudomaricurvus alkylphenolicus]
MNLTIKEKMYLLAAAVALVSLTILGVALYGIKSFNDIAHTRDLARETESRMLMLRRHEKDFFARKDLKYQGKFNEQLATLKQRLQELQAMSMTIGTASGDAEQLQTVFSTYGQKFEQVVNVMVRIGLDHKSGLHGDLRRAVHQAESMIRESGSDTLLSANLMLRRHEKDFFQRHDLKYAESFDATHQAFKEALLADGLASDSQRAILSQMETYQSLFHQTVDAYVQLGLDPRSGLHGEMRRAVHESETLLDSTIAHTVTAIEREQRRVEKTITTTALTLSLALIAVIIVLVRNIVRSLQRLLHEMNEIAEGDADLRVRLPDQGRDEMAHMATAFNRFVERIQGVVREVTDVSQNLASAADQTAVSIEHTAQMLNRQHRETEQVATAMNQMSATINEVANNAATAADATQCANSDSQRGKNIVNYSVESIRGVGHRRSQGLGDDRSTLPAGRVHRLYPRCH